MALKERRSTPEERREFGVKFSEVQVGRLLKKIGLSPQRPLYRAYQPKLSYILD